MQKLELEDFNTSEITEFVKATPIGFTKLSRLEYGPAYFIKSLRTTEEKDYFNFGKLVHALVLQPNVVEDMFYISDFVPSEGKWTNFVQTLFQSKGLLEQGLSQEDWYKAAYEASTLLSPKLDGAIKKFEEELALGVGYYSVLIAGEGKIFMSGKDYMRAEACANALLALSPSEYSDYLGLPNALIQMEGVEFYPELLIKWKDENFEFDIESTLDLVIIDHNKKKIIVFDLKTASKNVFVYFKESYQEYKYYRQASVYLRALMFWITQNNNEELYRDYEIEYIITAVQVMEPFSAQFYRPSNEDLGLGLIEFSNLLHRLKWHVDNNVWDRPREFHEVGIVELNLTDDFKDKITTAGN